MRIHALRSVFNTGKLQVGSCEPKADSQIQWIESVINGVPTATLERDSEIDSKKFYFNVSLITQISIYLYHY